MKIDRLGNYQLPIYHLFPIKILKKFLHNYSQFLLIDIVCSGEFFFPSKLLSHTKILQFSIKLNLIPHSSGRQQVEEITWSEYIVNTDVVLGFEPVKPFSKAGDIKLLNTIDVIYTNKHPYYGHRRVHKLLLRLGYDIGRKMVRKAMKFMGIKALYPKPKTIRDKSVYMHEWNQFALKNSLSQITSLTKSRRDKLDARLKSGEFEKLFERALDEIAKSQYLLGAKGWKVTFDWLIKNDENILKVVEGNYHDGEKKNPYADSLLNNLPKNYVVEDW